MVLYIVVLEVKVQATNPVFQNLESVLLRDAAGGGIHFQNWVQYSWNHEQQQDMMHGLRTETGGCVVGCSLR